MYQTFLKTAFAATAFSIAGYAQAASVVLIGADGTDDAELSDGAIDFPDAGNANLSVSATALNVRTTSNPGGTTTIEAIDGIGVLEPIVIDNHTLNLTTGGEDFPNVTFNQVDVNMTNSAVLNVNSSASINAPLPTDFLLSGGSHASFTAVGGELVFGLQDGSFGPFIPQARVQLSDSSFRAAAGEIRIFRTDFEIDTSSFFEFTFGSTNLFEDTSLVNFFVNYGLVDHAGTETVTLGRFTPTGSSFGFPQDFLALKIGVSRWPTSFRSLACQMT
ncbi:MAG: hypothetical protein AAGJ89_08485 [Pseudomonadota bacterium]